MRYLFLRLTICILTILPCLAEKPASKPASGKGSLRPPVTEKASFHPNIKRDPFKSLFVAVKKDGNKEMPTLPTFRPAGLPGIAVSEVSVIGVASNVNSRLAILQGKEKVSYFGKVGDKLFNGFISQIDPDKVTFVEEAVGPDGKKMQKQSIKRLYAEMESPQQRRE